MARDKPSKDANEGDERTIIFWLGRELRDVRESQGRSLSAMAKWTGGDGSRLSNMERGLSWPRDLEAIVTAYAYLCEPPLDPKDIIRRGVSAYLEHAEIMLPHKLSPREAALLLAQQADQRNEPYAAGFRGKPISSPRRRAK